MNPGIYEISNEEYHSSEGISRSGISLIKKSPLHYWDRYLNPEIEADEKSQSNSSTLFGNLVHTLILEPTEFDKRYVIGPDINKNTKEYKSFKDEHKHLTIIDSNCYAKAIKAKDSVEKHSIASQLINGGLVEKSIYWLDKDTGVLCKARPDIMQKRLIVDIKTTACARKYDFSRSVYSYGYHIQAAMALDAAESLGYEYHANFIFIAIESESPYAVAVYILQDEAIDVGREEYKQALEIYAECKATNVWPSYSTEVEEINLPRYAFL